MKKILMGLILSGAAASSAFAAGSTPTDSDAVFAQAGKGQASVMSVNEMAETQGASAIRDAMSNAVWCITHKPTFFSSAIDRAVYRVMCM